MQKWPLQPCLFGPCMIVGYLRIRNRSKSFSSTVMMNCCPYSGRERKKARKRSFNRTERDDSTNPYTKSLTQNVRPELWVLTVFPRQERSFTILRRAVI